MMIRSGCRFRPVRVFGAGMPRRELRDLALVAWTSTWYNDCRKDWWCGVRSIINCDGHVNGGSGVVEGVVCGVPCVVYGVWCVVCGGWSSETVSWHSARLGGTSPPRKPWNTILNRDSTASNYIS